MSLTKKVKEGFEIAYQPAFAWSTAFSLVVGAYGGIKGVSVENPLIYLPALTQAGLFGLAGLIVGVMADGAPHRLTARAINTFVSNEPGDEVSVMPRMATAGLYLGAGIGALKGGIETLIGYGIGSMIGGN